MALRRLRQWWQDVRPVSLQDRAVFFRQFSILINSGVPIARSLDIVVRQTVEPRLKAALTVICKTVENGFPLSRGFAVHKGCFTLMHAALIKTAEQSGTLHRILDQLAAHEERELAIRRQILSALTYPAFVLGAGALFVFLLLKYLLPPLLDAQTHLSNAPQPLPTRMLMGVAAVLGNHWIMAGLGAFLLMAVYFIRQFFKTAQGRHLWDAWKITMPLAGPLIRRILIVRMCVTLETLYRSGMRTLDALRITADVIDNTFLRERIITIVSDDITTGRTLAQALARTEAVPKVVIHLVKVGEDTGHLGRMLAKASDILQMDVENGLRQFTAMLEPVLVCVLGAFTCLCLMAALMPLYQAAAQLGLNK